MDENKTTEQEQDFIDKVLETTKEGAKKLSKAAAKGLAGAALATGLMVGGMATDLPGMEVSEAQAAHFVANPKKNTSFVNLGNTGGGYAGGGSYRAPRSTGYSNQTVVVNKKPSEGDIFRGALMGTLGNGVGNIINSFGSSLFGVNNIGGLYDCYGIAPGSRYLSTNQEIRLSRLRSAHLDWSSRKYVTVADAIAGARTIVQPVIQNDSAALAKFNQIITHYTKINAELSKISKGINEANKKLDDIGTELTKQGKSVEDIKVTQDMMRQEAINHYSALVNKLTEENKALIAKIDANQDAVLKAIDKEGVHARNYFWALMALGVVGFGAAAWLTMQKFNIADKKFDTIAANTNVIARNTSIISDTTFATFEQIESLTKDISDIRDTTDVTLELVNRGQENLPSSNGAYERTKARLQFQKDKEYSNETKSTGKQAEVPVETINPNSAYARTKARLQAAAAADKEMDR